MTTSAQKWQRKVTEPAKTLYVDLVPSTSWCANLRAVFKKSQWEKIARVVYHNAGNQCECCSGRGPKHPVECHERWRFENGIQILSGLEALCPACHESTHMGLAEVRGNGPRALTHLAKVNDWTYAQAMEHRNQAFALWKARSDIEWQIDISFIGEWLTKNHVDISLEKDISSGRRSPKP